MHVQLTTCTYAIQLPLESHAAAVQAQRREPWGEPPHDAASTVIRPRPHGRSAFTYDALEREDHV